MQLKKVSIKRALYNPSEWKDIPGNPWYEIHFRGYVRNKNTGKILSAGLAGNGYLTVGLRSKTHTIHRLVACAFIGQPSEKLVVNHIDGNKLNNHVANLEFVTSGQNNSHAIRTGLKKSAYPARGVIQMDMNGSEIARYKTTEDVPAPFQPGCVALVCRGKRNHHRGFMWKYIN